MKRALYNITFYLLSTVVALALPSCASSGPRDEGGHQAASPRLRLRFISSWGGVDSKAEALQEVLNGFEAENPDIEVINESLFGEDFLPKIKTDFASGNNPDVFGLWPGSDIRALIKAGKVADLSDLLNSEPEWKNDFNSVMWDYTMFDGKLYGLPLESIFECLFINSDLFEKYGVRVPESYEELKEAVVVFRENGLIPIAYNSAAEGTYIYQNIAAMLGGKQAIEQPFLYGNGGGHFVRAMEYMKELYRLGAFPHNFFTITNSERNNLFRDKKAAMIVQGSWFIGNLKETENTVDIVPFPAFEGGAAPAGTIIHGLGCGNFHMSATAWESHKREGAVKLLKELTSKETASYLVEQTGMVSVVETSDEIKYGKLAEKGRALFSNALVLIGPPDSFVDRSVWEKTVVGNFPYILEDKREPQEVWNEALRKGIIDAD